jgi:hypothetical protein
VKALRDMMVGRGAGGRRNVERMVASVGAMMEAICLVKTQQVRSQNQRKSFQK